MLTSSFSMSTKFFNFFLSFSAFPHQRRLLIYHIQTINVNTFNKSSSSYITNTFLCVSNSPKQTKMILYLSSIAFLQLHEYAHLQNQIKVPLTLSLICIPSLFSLLCQHQPKQMITSIIPYVTINVPLIFTYYNPIIHYIHYLRY